MKVQFGCEYVNILSESKQHSHGCIYMKLLNKSTNSGLSLLIHGFISLLVTMGCHVIKIFLIVQYHNPRNYNHMSN